LFGFPRMETHTLTTQAIAKYSQQDEQRFILQTLEGLPHGRFLDIGAWDPKTFSNSRALYELGWEGVLVEGSPLPVRNLLREYGTDPRVRVVSAFVGFPEQLARVHITDDAVSTTEEAEYDRWKNMARFEGELFIPIISFSQIFDTFGSHFDFVSIDTEGTSVDLLRQMLSHREFWNKNLRPRCICVEYNDRLEEAISLATQAGFSVVHHNDTNVIFGGAR